MFHLFSQDNARRRKVELWVKTYSTELYRFAVLRTESKEEAEDMVQQTFVKAFVAFDTFVPGTNERAWLYTILNNLIRDCFQRAARRPVLVPLLENDQDCFLDNSQNPETQLSSKMDLEELATAVSSLPETFATPLLMHEVAQISYEEIAKTLQIPIGTVMSRLFRARKALFEMLVRDKEAPVPGKTVKLRKGERDGLS